MKAIVETTKPIMLVDPYSGDLVEPDRPYVVAFTQFIQSRIGSGELRVLKGGLPETASDAEFAKFFKDSDGKADLAVEAFASGLEGEKEAEPAPEPKPAAKPAARKAAKKTEA